MNGKECVAVAAIIALLSGLIIGLSSCVPDAPSQWVGVGEHHVIELAG